MRIPGTALLALSMTGTVLAATCPPAKDVAQVQAGEGYRYSAPGGWKGENPRGNEEDLDGLKIVGAKITEKSVICQYEGKRGVSLTLDGSKHAEGSNWNDGQCTASDTSDCRFQ